MKYIKSFGIIAIGFIVYLLTNWLNPPKEISPIFIGGLTALIIWLSQKHFDSGRSEASFKEQISSLNNEKDEIRFNYQKTISNLKAENNELVEKLSKYTHREKLLSKYTHDEDWGYWTHIEDRKSVV